MTEMPNASAYTPVASRRRTGMALPRAQTSARAARGLGGGQRVDQPIDRGALRGREGLELREAGARLRGDRRRAVAVQLGDEIGERALAGGAQDRRRGFATGDRQAQTV